MKTWLILIRFSFIRVNIGCNNFIIYHILHLTSFQILYFGLSEFSWQICPVSVRSFVKMLSDVCLSEFKKKKLSVVCLSDRTRTRQSCPDFHCPCPPTSALHHFGAVHFGRSSLEKLGFGPGNPKYIILWKSIFLRRHFLLNFRYLNWQVASVFDHLRPKRGD